MPSAGKGCAVRLSTMMMMMMMSLEYLQESGKYVVVAE